MRWPVDSPHKGPVMRKMFPSDDVIMMFNSMQKPGTFKNVYFNNNDDDIDNNKNNGNNDDNNNDNNDTKSDNHTTTIDDNNHNDNNDNDMNNRNNNNASILKQPTGVGFCRIFAYTINKLNYWTVLLRRGCFGWQGFVWILLFNKIETNKDIKSHRHMPFWWGPEGIYKYKAYMIMDELHTTCVCFWPAFDHQYNAILQWRAWR